MTHKTFTWKNSYLKYYFHLKNNNYYYLFGKNNLSVKNCTTLTFNKKPYTDSTKITILSKFLKPYNISRVKLITILLKQKYPYFINNTNLFQYPTFMFKVVSNLQGNNNTNFHKTFTKQFNISYSKYLLCNHATFEIPLILNFIDNNNTNYYLYWRNTILKLKTPPTHYSTKTIINMLRLDYEVVGKKNYFKGIFFKYTPYVLKYTTYDSTVFSLSQASIPIFPPLKTKTNFLTNTVKGYDIPFLIKKTFPQKQQFFNKTEKLIFDKALVRNSYDKITFLSLGIFSYNKYKWYVFFKKIPLLIFI